MVIAPAEYIVNILGGQTQVAIIVGVTRQTIHRWLKPRDEGGLGGTVPRKYIAQLVDAAVAKGHDVTDRDLVRGREVDGRVWRKRSAG